MISILGSFSPKAVATDLDDDGSAILSYWMLWGARGIGLAKSNDEKISELESELEEIKLKVEEKSKLNLDEREELKIKIKDLITRVDKHLATDWSG